MPPAAPAPAARTQRDLPSARETFMRIPFMHVPFGPTPRRLLLGAAAAALAGCQQAKSAPPPPPPAEVSVVTATPQTTEEPLEFEGQVRAFRTVQVRAQVSGVITARPFTEGTEVRAGDVLYRIDPTTYDADYRGSVARAAQAQAQLSNAQTNAGRLRPLLADNAVARQDVDNAESGVAQYRAALADARATVDRSRKSLSETVVRAEISGRVGRALLDLGTRVTGPGDVLTTVDVVDPVYVSFRPSARQLLRWRRDPALARAIAPGGAARVEAVLADGHPFPGEGRIGYVDPVVDSATGTQEYRATFVHPRALLVPGQFVRVRLRGLERRDAILVPQRAVIEQMGRQTVYVVDSSNKIVARQVTATGWSGGDWLIEQGLAPGERVVVDGVQKIGPGAPVRPTPLAAAAAGGSAATTPPAAAARSGS
ncbi:MexX family efflux pump subunit [Gemmatimonadetes bacterium T265]|nr:MexX family efflux pump subunit [Gemmatimonadetes bacterium T265]